MATSSLQVARTRLANTKHGKKGTRVYRIWSGMLNRCRNRNDKDYPRWGGRGISVCERWLKFENFYADMGEPTSDAHSIDRFPNNDGNYEPGNCRWATAQQQAANRRTARGERNGNAKLTPAGVAGVRLMRLSGKSFAQIAAAHEISKRQVGRIVHRRAWTQQLIEDKTGSAIVAIGLDAPNTEGTNDDERVA